MLNRKEPLESHLKNTNTICSTARPSNHGERQGRTRGVARGGGCWRCAQAAATRGDVSREWRFPRDPPFFPCAVCVVVTRMPGQVFQCKKQNAKRSCSIALSSSFRMPYSPRRSDKRRSFLFLATVHVRHGEDLYCPFGQFSEWWW